MGVGVGVGVRGEEATSMKQNYPWYFTFFHQVNSIYAAERDPCKEVLSGQSGHLSRHGRLAMNLNTYKFKFSIARITSESSQPDRHRLNWFKLNTDGAFKKGINLEAGGGQRRRAAGLIGYTRTMRFLAKPGGGIVGS